MRGSFQRGAAAAAALAVVLLAGLHPLGAAERKIASAPAFSSRQLLDHPRRNWVANGGTVYNQRYSPLTLLNRDNVGNLKALWRTSMGSGALPNNSGQAQILHYEGVL